MHIDIQRHFQKENVEAGCKIHTKLPSRGDVCSTPSCRRDGMLVSHQAVVEACCWIHPKLSLKEDASFTTGCRRGLLLDTPSCHQKRMPLSYQAVVEAGCLVPTKLSSRGDVCSIQGCRRGLLLDTHEAVVDDEEFIGEGCISRGQFFVSPVRQPLSVIPSVEI